MNNPIEPLSNDDPAALWVENEALRQRLAELETHEAEYQRAAKIQAALYRIANAASTVEDMPAFYAAMYQIVGELMYANNFYIALYNEVRQMINFPYYVDEVDQDVPDPRQWDSLGLGEARGFTAYILRTGQPIHITPEVEADLVRRGEVELVGAASVDWLGVPLKTGGHTLGALVVQSYTKGIHYSDQDLEVLTFVGQHIAAALERARLQTETRELLAETQQRNAELAIINSIQRGLASQLDMQAVYNLVGDKVLEIFDAQSVGITIYERRTNLMHYPYISEKGERFYLEPEPLSGGGFILHIIRTGQPLLLNQDIERHAVEYGSSIQTGEDIKSFLGVPLLIGSEVRGVIDLQNIDRENAFSDSDLRLLTTLAASRITHQPDSGRLGNLWRLALSQWGWGECHGGKRLSNLERRI